MEAIDIRVLARDRATEEEVQRAIDTIRQVEHLGGRRSEYNLAAPFSRLQPPPVASGRLSSRRK